MTERTAAEASACAMCGHQWPAGSGAWACHVDDDVTPVCTGPCFRAYNAKKAEAQAERGLLDTLKRWGGL